MRSPYDIGSKRTNHQFGCFGEVCKSNILMPSKIPCICILFFSFFFFFEKVGGNCLIYYRMFQAHQLSSFCLFHVAGMYTTEEEPALPWLVFKYGCKVIPCRPVYFFYLAGSSLKSWYIKALLFMTLSIQNLYR